MDLISWSLNAIDKIFFTGKQGIGEPACPAGTHFAGYTLDSWSAWRSVCLSIISVEDVEDVYIFGFMILGMLLIGAGGYLTYRKVEMMLAAVLGRPSAVTEGLNRALNAQTHTLNELKSKLDATLDRLREMESNLVKLRALTER